MKHLILLISLIAFTLTSCSGSSDSDAKTEDSKTKSDSLSQDDTTKVGGEDSMIEAEKIDIDAYANDVARVVAGLPILGTDSVLAQIQSEDYYKSYKKFCDDSFSTIQSDMLDPIKKWTAANGVQDNRKNSTCFYPFSGPDFMFANAFYPKAANYILLGLERRGTLPRFDKMDESQRKGYFQGMIKSMKYINTRGYFVTQHMGSDYTKTHLNGVTHMALYMMARTGHSIVSVGDGWLSKEGKLTKIDEGADVPEDHVRMKIIEFTDADQTALRTLYFFNHNIADEAAANHMEMATFIKNFPNKGAYLKAAQCAAFNANFKTARELVLGCDLVIQDDSGIPYSHLSDTTVYDTKLFGTYTTVISDLKWCFQPKLKKDLETKGDNSDLPFKISYNGNYGKGVIIFAKKK